MLHGSRSGHRWLAGRFVPSVVILILFLPGVGCRETIESQVGELKVPMPQSWSGADGGVSDPGSVYADDWLRSFHDPELLALVESARASNYNLKAASERLLVNRAEVAIAGASRLPGVTAEGSYEKRKNTFVGLFSGTIDTVQGSLNLSWELDIWGKIRDGRLAAVAAYEAGESDLLGAVLSLEGQLAKAWFRAIESHLQAELALETTENLEANTRILQKRFQRGLGSALDVRLSRTQSLASRAIYERELSNRNASIRFVEVLLGDYPGRTLSLRETLPEMIDAVPAGLPSELLLRRPDLMAAERRLAALEAQHRVARKNRLPSIRLTGSTGRISQAVADFTDETIDVWSIFSGLSQPLFQGGRLKAAEKKAAAQYREFLARFSDLVLNAFREVETTLDNEQFLERQADLLGQAVIESKRADALVWERYGRGVVDIATVLEAQRQAFSTRSQYLGVQNALLQNRIDLYLAIGGDFGRQESEP